MKGGVLVFAIIAAADVRDHKVSNYKARAHKAHDHVVQDHLNGKMEGSIIEISSRV